MFPTQNRASNGPLGLKAHLMGNLRGAGWIDMRNLVREIEHQLRHHRLPALGDALPDGEFILPHYDGLSIANLPATTAAILGVPFDTLPPLPRDIWAPLAGGVRCVVRIIVDALGYDRLRQVLDSRPDMPLHRLLRRGGRLTPLTSVCPATTVSALATLWSGHTPAEHGLVGTRLFLRERGLRAHMIYFSPDGFEHQGTLLEEGLDPAQLLPVPGFAQTLADAGISTHILINKHYTGPGLSDIFFRGVHTIHPIVPGSHADLWITLRRLLEEQAGERLFIAAYWGTLDSLAHERGPASPTLDAELTQWTTLMAHECLDRLSPAAADGVLLSILADHGQVDVSPKDAVPLDQHPALQRELLMDPLGEHRLPYLFVRQGRLDAVRNYIRQHLSHAFIPLDAQRALQAGLFGPGTPAPETAVRLGDLILVSRRNHILHDKPDPLHMRGFHGGLSRQEMLVPCLFARLDS